MFTHYSDAVESTEAEKSPRDLLQSPVTVLLGVDDEASEALQSIGIKSVHDLATSPVFEVAWAVHVAASSGEPSGSTERVTAVAAANRTGVDDLADLFAADIRELEGVTEEAAEELKGALGVSTIRDLAHWSPYQGARGVLAALTGEGAETERGVPEALVPVARKYGTEETFYTKVYVDRLVTELNEHGEGFGGGSLDRDDLLENLREHGVNADWTPNWGSIADGIEEARDRESEDEDEGEEDIPAQPMSLLMPTTEDIVGSAADRRVDVTKPLPNVGGFRQPAVGGIIQYGQKWVPQGLSLGQLLHSTTLAPGESTRIAVIDWSRQMRGEREETESQRERMDASIVQKRSIQEVQDGVTSEVQSGRSMVSSTSTTEEKGYTHNEGVFGTGGSHSGGKSTTSTEATTVSTSKGRRKVHAEMTQKIRNSTQQHASSARTRRATVVRETEQEESEEVRTRVVTNHNHMHALSVHYYEVVQIYRVEVGPEDAQPVLFVPFKPLNFTEDSTIKQYRQALLDAAISEQAFDLLSSVTGKVRVTKQLDESVERPLNPHQRSVEQKQRDRLSEVGITGSMYEGVYRVPDDARITEFRYGADDGIESIKILLRERDDQTLRDEQATDTGSQSRRLELPTPVMLNDVWRIVVNGSFESDDELSVLMEVELDQDGQAVGRAIEVGGVTIAGQRQGISTPIADVERTRAQAAKAHLQENQLHYSQAVWRSLDPQTVTILLSEFQIDDRSAAEFVDPTPEAVHGNYVAFPLAIPETLENTTDETYAKLAWWWERWTEDNFDAKYRERDLVPIPSGGVHGESILGRANGAEKLDITRFWDWQESPVPQQSPQIAPIQTGSRATDEDLTPSGFEQPIVQLQQPQRLPDPTGVGAALDLLGQSGIFRDMSGIEAAADVARTTSQLSGQGARHATDAAVETFKTGARAQNQALSTVADTITSLAGGGAFSASNAGNSSFGAALNEAKKMDGTSAARGQLGGQAGNADGATGGGDSEVGNGTGGAGGSGGGRGGTTSESDGTRTGGNDDSLARRMLEARSGTGGGSGSSGGGRPSAGVYGSPPEEVLNVADWTQRILTARNWKQGLVDASLTEEDYWTQSGGAKVTEGNEADKLKTYYRAVADNSNISWDWLKKGVKVDPSSVSGGWINNYSDSDGDGKVEVPFWVAAAHDLEPWSAVFVSYVASQAGIGADDGFAFHFRHMNYIVQARANRMNEAFDRPFWLYDVDEITPGPGDILCKNRVKDGNCTSHTFENLDSYIQTDDGGRASPVDNVTGSSHCDVVVNAGVAGGTQFIETIGGNTLDQSGTADTVGRKRWELGGNGRWQRVHQSNSCDVFAFIRVVAPEPTADSSIQATSPEI